MTDKRSVSDKTTNREDTKFMIIQCKILHSVNISDILGICILAKNSDIGLELGNCIRG